VQFLNQIDVEDLILSDDKYVVIDVRTGDEYLEGSVLESINIPLFNEAEREKIGLVYKKSPKAARFLALDIVGPKLSRFIRKIYGICQGKIPVAVCWRGGMRSRATVELLQMAGIEALQLRGGYRRYRQHMYQQLNGFQLKSQLVVIKGKSGTGKTEILNILADWGQPVLDLEGLASHRGSTFGGHELEAAATQKNFDIYLLKELQRLEGQKWILVEGESKRIGNIYLPNFLFEAMQNAPVIEVESAMEKRVARIVMDYSPQSHQARLQMYRALFRLKHRLSKANLSELKQCLDDEDYHRFVQLVLTTHYDNNYDHQLPGKKVLSIINSDNLQQAANDIMTCLVSEQ